MPSLRKSLQARIVAYVLSLSLLAVGLVAAIACSQSRALPQDAALNLAWLLVFAGLAVAMASTLGAYLLARQITRPMLCIMDALGQVAAGDLSPAVYVVTEDELGALACAFNRMTEQLRARYENLDLDSTGWKRTQEERERLITDLETKNAELERFAYTVSHDLKSPLVTIQGFLGLLEKDMHTGDTLRMERDIQLIRQAAEQMQHLLAALLELSRSGHLANPPETVFLSEVAHEAVAVVGGQIEERGVEVRIEPALPAVLGDRLRLLEVFQNLLDNAVKFMGSQPHPMIEIGAEPYEDQVLFYVRDNGIGLDPQDQEKIFGLFERLHAGDNGTGIGLALVQRIIHVHGGRIWAASEGEGYGTTFFVTLPPAPSVPAVQDALMVSATGL